MADYLIEVVQFEDRLVGRIADAGSWRLGLELSWPDLAGMLEPGKTATEVLEGHVAQDTREQCCFHA